jgi:hypothetical protein
MIHGTLDPMSQLNFGRLEKNTTYLIVGPRGTGKTLFCMLAAISFALKDRRSLYLITQSDLSFKLAENLIGNHRLPIKILDNVIFVRPTNRNIEPGIPRLIEATRPSIFIFDEIIWGYGSYVMENIELAVYRSRLLSNMLAEIHSLRESVGFTTIYTADTQQGGRVLASKVLGYFSDIVVEFIKQRGYQGSYRAVLRSDKLRPKSYSYTIDKLGFHIGENN